MSHVTCDKKQKDAPRLCGSESARITMPNRVKHEIFAKQFFRAGNKKKKPNNSRKILINPEIFMTLGQYNTMVQNTVKLKIFVKY